MGEFRFFRIERVVRLRKVDYRGRSRANKDLSVQFGDFGRIAKGEKLSAISFQRSVGGGDGPGNAWDGACCGLVPAGVGVEHGETTGEFPAVAGEPFRGAKAVGLVIDFLSESQTLVSDAPASAVAL